jgi:ribA/ribD-fused uncharacterized protein
LTPTPDPGSAAPKVRLTVSPELWDRIGGVVKGLGALMVGSTVAGELHEHLDLFDRVAGDVAKAASRANVVTGTIGVMTTARFAALGAPPLFAQIAGYCADRGTRSLTGDLVADADRTRALVIDTLTTAFLLADTLYCSKNGLLSLCDSVDILLRKTHSEDRLETLLDQLLPEKPQKQDLPFEPQATGPKDAPSSFAGLAEEPNREPATAAGKAGPAWTPFQPKADAPVYFFDHMETHEGNFAPGCLDQWWPSPIRIGGRRYPTAEHFMMWSKAMLFGDEATAKAILLTDDPEQAQQLGRLVAGFDREIWDREKLPIVVEANIAKFAQHAELGDFLLYTGDRLLVEANPEDSTWAIGLADDDPRAADPRMWRGSNLLGYALMTTRDHLRRARNLQRRS